MSYFVEDQEEENERFAETIQALRRQVRTLTAERDEARADAERFEAAWVSSSNRTAEHAAYIEVLGTERNEARAEVVRLGKQVEAARLAHDHLIRRLADGAPLDGGDLRPLFDALFPKWSETS